MNRMPIHLALLFLLILTTSCAREVFPDEDQIIGHWREQDATKASDQLYELDITGTQFSMISPDSLVSTYNYSLEKDSHSILLTDPSGGGTAALGIEYDRKEDLLGIYGFFIAIPEDQRWTHFERID